MYITGECRMIVIVLLLCVSCALTEDRLSVETLRDESVIENVLQRIESGRWIEGHKNQELTLSCPNQERIVINFVKYSAVHPQSGELVSRIAPKLILLLCGFRAECRVTVDDHWLRVDDWSIFTYDHTLRINYACERSDVRVAIGCQPLPPGHPDHDPGYKNATFRCDPGQVVKISSAFYGRLGWGVCSWGHWDALMKTNARLIIDVSRALQRLCWNRQTCSTAVNPETMDVSTQIRRRPNFRSTKRKYMMARYLCIPRIH